MHATILHVVEVGASKRDTGPLEQDARDPRTRSISRLSYQAHIFAPHHVHTDPIAHSDLNEEASLLRPRRNYKHHACYAYILPGFRSVFHYDPLEFTPLLASSFAQDRQKINQETTEFHATSNKIHAKDHTRSLWKVLTYSEIGIESSVRSGDRRVCLFSASRRIPGMLSIQLAL
ncbi:hypothetical protein VNO77_30715 [Canavalia gladiata]|uniref:Uncharacterized protein n=1 Tax=Canavalia gladiata TaxID=3824 RepID=A0AAN9Q7E2_CANGL